ncbi:hypothetical protein G6L37_05970 [Agrobacterium rubi]|nr:hypothetical protein [Agrobacterium rubi]NTF24907.1 hypothetical protein [Agrobacterium rubi]
MTKETRIPRIYIEIDGGCVQVITVDGEAEIVVVDYDNAGDPEFDEDSVEAMLDGDLHRGTAEEFDAQIATARTALEEIASRNSDEMAP